MRLILVLVPLVLGLAAAPAQAATFIVNSADDVSDAVCNATHCSLREAITAANADGAAGNRIEFDLPGATDIHPATALPVISASGLTIDGLTQSGSSTAPLVPVVAVLGNLCSSCSGLRVSGSNVTIEGLVVGQWMDGIWIQSTSSGSVVRRNWIGLSQTGLAAAGNTQGVLVDGDFASIGGLVSRAGNVVSGNASGITLGSTALGTMIVGNDVGLPANGGTQTACVSNTVYGIRVLGDSAVIGDVAAPNVFACNTEGAIRIESNADGTVVVGNRVGEPGGRAMITAPQKRGIDTYGTNAVVGRPDAGNALALNSESSIFVGAGNAVVQGNFIGVDFDGATTFPDLPYDTGIHTSIGAVIGGANPGEGNIVCDAYVAMSIYGGPTTVMGNSIGVTSSGTVRGNSYGVYIGSNPVITIGGTGVGEGNVIAGTVGDGIDITPSSFALVEVVGNRMFQNGGLGFDIGSNGPTSNDSLDADIGANGVQNFPVVTSATIEDVTGMLHSNPSTSFFVDFYANAACDGSGFGEGETYLTSIALTTNSQGNASFADVPYGSTLSGTAVVTAVARRVDSGATSEFSACRLVAPPTADIAVQSAPVAPVVDLGNDVRWDLTVSNAGPNAAEVTELEITLPAGATFLSAVPVTGSCSHASGVVTCLLGTVTAGASKTVAVDASLDGGGDLSLIAAATTITQQPYLTDDSVVSPIRVNRPPSLPDAMVAVDEDVAKMITVLATDLDGDTLQWSLQSSPLSGVLSGTLPNVTYTPGPNFFGSDSFDVEVFDGRLLSGVATIMLAIASVNDAPVAGVDDYLLVEDGLISVAATGGVLSNDSDVEGSMLSAVLVDDVAYGTLLLQGDGSFDYEPDADFSGIETFTYRAFDGDDSSSVTSVSIVVTALGDAPIAFGDDYDGTEDGVLVIDAASGLLANDVDADVSVGLLVELVSGATSGTLILGADGGFFYQPDPDFSGVDVFTYRVSDGVFLSGDVIVSLTMAPSPDDPPSPIISEPADGAVVVDPIEFAWTAVSDADGETVSYRLEIMKEAEIIATLETSGTTLSVPGDAIPGSGTFFWQLVAVDASGAESQPTALRAFVIEGSGTEGDCSCTLQGRTRTSPSLFLLAGVLLLCDRVRARRLRAKRG